jgi:plastocyanin
MFKNTSPRPRRLALGRGLGRLGALLALCASLVNRAWCAEPTATIEGSITLPKSLAPAPAAPRYQSGPTAAAPEPSAAVVYLEGAPATATAGAATKATMAQQNLQFAPGLLVIQKGTTVEFPNLDEVYHNVFSYSKTKRFDLGRYLKDEKPAAQTFDQPGVVKLYCEIHSHMRGTIVVLDTPHFTKTATNGTYRLGNLPAGKFVLKAWVDEKTTLEKPVELKAGETLRVDFPVK